MIVMQSPASEEHWTPGGSSDRTPHRNPRWEEQQGAEAQQQQQQHHHHPHHHHDAHQQHHRGGAAGGSGEVALPQWMVEEAARALTPTTLLLEPSAERAPGPHQQARQQQQHQQQDTSLDSARPSGHASSLGTPTKVLNFLPDLHAASDPDPASELQEDESEGRAAVTAQVATPRRFVYSMLEADSSVGSIRTIAPLRLWGSDITRYALILSVARADVASVEQIVTSAFRAYHSCKVPEARPLPRLLTEVGASYIGDADSFIELATELLLGETDPTRQPRRAEVFRLLISAPEMCVSPKDEASLQRAAASLPEGHTVRFWLGYARSVSCALFGCNRVPPMPPAPSEEPDYPALPCWTPGGAGHFPAVFLRRVAAAARVGHSRGMSVCDTHSVLGFMDYSTNTSRKDPVHPTRVRVVDQVLGEVELFDASPVVMKRFACSRVAGGHVPWAGMRIAVTMADQKGTHSATGHLVGCLEGSLYWRPSGSLGCEQLPHAFTLNPLAAQNNLEMPAGDLWMCGMCLLVNSMRLRRCRRCCNTHQGSLALETQRRRQHVQHQPGRGQHGDRGGGHSHGGGGGGGHHSAGGGKQQGVAHASGAMHAPVVELNLSVHPPVQEQFETAEYFLGMFGVHSGEVIRAGACTGIIVGIGHDEALYWREDGAPGATRLARTPDDLLRLV